MFVEIVLTVSLFINLLSHHDGFHQLSRVHFNTRLEKFLLLVQDHVLSEAVRRAREA